MSEKYYCENPFLPKRRKTRVVAVGEVAVGGDNPIRIQSMTTTDTMDTAATVAQIMALAEAGCEIVRVTAPSINEAENLRNIKHELKTRGVAVPLVADIHYTPNAALKAVEFVEKVRINPGNYADRKKFAVREYSEREYDLELERIAEKFSPLVLKAKHYGVALRIGTNHGSLSDRILNRYGDTPLGMVESALEFVRICEDCGFRDIILSMKAANPQIMIQAYRLLAARLDELGMDYPFHLGVTEAGDGLEGRVKSAIGIGALLADGIGDTIRVSLTEDPVAEITPAFAIAAPYQDLFTGHGARSGAQAPPASPRYASEAAEVPLSRTPYAYHRRETRELEVGPMKIGGSQPVRVALRLEDPERLFTFLEGGKPGAGDRPCELLLLAGEAACPRTLAELQSHRREALRNTALGACLRGDPERAISLLPGLDLAGYLPDPRLSRAEWRSALSAWIRAAAAHGTPLLWELGFSGLPLYLRAERGENLEALAALAVELETLALQAGWEPSLFALSEPATIPAYRFLAQALDRRVPAAPLLLSSSAPSAGIPPWVETSIVPGSLLCDGIGDGIALSSTLPPEQTIEFCFTILQGSRLRLSRTEFISCPSCGRTLFDLETTTRRIKSRVAHLKGVKVAIMGCIVNGPGEMADADFGYVGAGPNKINLYVGRECVERNIPTTRAEDRLVELIKSRGLWVEVP